MVKYLLNKMLRNDVITIFNMVFKDGTKSIDVVDNDLIISPAKDKLYAALEDYRYSYGVDQFRDDALTAEQLHVELAKVYDEVRAPGETPSNLLKGGRRKSSTRRSKRKARKTRSRR